MIVLYILLAILILMFMIMIHELGHYLAGKLLKFRIEEFSIGFGKALFSKTLKSGEVFSIRLIPLGGYCAFKGEDEEGNEDPECFNSYACWKRIIVLISGALFNFVSGILFTFVLLLVVGTGTAKITKIYDDSVNKDKIFISDIILEVDGVAPTFLNGGIGGLMKTKDVGDDIILTISRDGEIQNVTVQKYETKQLDDKDNVVYDEDNNPVMVKIIGIKSEYVPCSFGEALLKSVPYTFKIAWECLVILGNLFTGNVGLDSIGGPITTVQTIAEASAMSLKNLVLLFPLIAVNLAVFNLLPVRKSYSAVILCLKLE